MQVSTAACAPEDPPRNLTITQESDTRALANWGIPETEAGEALPEITGYRLFYDREDTDEFEEIELPADRFGAIMIYRLSAR